METKTVYHYSDSKFNEFDISKSDGFWFTSIKPQYAEMLNEIGASGCKYCARCEITYEESFNGDNYDVLAQLENSEYDCIKNTYEDPNGNTATFTDYALIDNSKIKILEWIEL